MKWLAALLVLLLTATLGLACEEEEQEAGLLVATPTVAATPTPAPPTEVASPTAEAPPATEEPSPATPEVTEEPPQPTPTELPAEATEVIIVQPSALSVVEEVEGHCWTASSKAVRPNAWRCAEDSTGHDPCFSESVDDAFVICAVDPETGVKMNLTEPLPASAGHEEEDPSYAWILALADGTTCTFIAGATGTVDGERANYLCSDEWWVVGLPEVDTVWTVHKVLMSEARDRAVAEADVAVTTVWR